MSSPGFPFLVYDQTPDNLRCTACNLCAKECPTKCIQIVREFGADGSPQKKPMVFDIDAAVCAGCGVCEKVCPFDAIFLDPGFIPEKCIQHKMDLLKPDEHFHQVRPDDAAAIDQRRQSGEKKPPAVP